MLVAISATGPTVNDEVDSRFGRCPYFITVDFDTMKVESLPNSNAMTGGGAGVSTAQMIASRGVEMVLTGSCGPNAFQILSAANVKIVSGVRGKISNVINSYKQGSFEPVSESSVPTYFGRRWMRGMGGGMGMGRGKGGRMMPSVAPPPEPTTPEQELEELKAQSQKLAQQLAEIRHRIEEAEKKAE